MNTEEGIQTKQGPGIEELAEIPKLLDQLTSINEGVISGFQTLRDKLSPILNYSPRPESGEARDIPERYTELGSRLQADINHMTNLKDELYDIIERVEL